MARLFWLGLVALLLVAWMGRYEVYGPAERGIGYKLDRWTGKTYFMMAGKEYPVAVLATPFGK